MIKLTHTIDLKRWMGLLSTLLAVGMLFVGVSVAQAKTDDQQAGKHVLTVYDGGKEVGILTDADTLGEALKQSGVVINQNDVTEPGLDEELVAGSYRVNIYRARPVMVVDGGNTTKIMSPYRSVDQIAEQANIELRDEDEVKLTASTSSVVSDGALERMVIDRATAFTFIMYGKEIKSYTQAETVGDMLKEKKIKLNKNDRLSVDLDTLIKAGMKVELSREGKQVVTEEETVDFAIEQIEDMDREVGYKQIKTPGQKGKRSVSYEIIIKNGKEVSRKEIRSVTIEEPKKQVEIVGGKMTNTFDGDFAGALARLRSCEGSYTSNTGNGYYGAYQYDIATWGNYKGYSNASQAPPSVQDEKAWLTYQARGWQPWPSCSRSQGLQDIYR